MVHKNWFFTLMLIAFSVFFVTGETGMVSADPGMNEGIANQALCLPGNDVSTTDCLEAGPISRLKELASIGITFPPAPLLAATPPYELSRIPFSYALLSKEEVSLYATLEDAMNGRVTNKLGKSGIKYVSLLNKSSTDKGTFYQISTTEWISSNDMQKVGVQNFQGYEFKQNPDFVFGWVLSETISRTEPDYYAPETGKKYWRYNVVHIYDARVVNEIEWVMVAPDEWIEHRFVGRVIPNYERPEGVTSDRWIEINLYEQVLNIYDSGRLVFATLISTGVHPFYTQPGVFTIYKKLVNDPMMGSFEADRSDYYYLEDVPFIMYYDQDRALHGAYWNTLFGYQRSHGCVNLSVADAHWVFDWANMGDYVYVWDPSGKTPTDPALYGSGGF